MTIQDKARIIARDTTRDIPTHIVASCIRIVVGKALHEQVSPIDKHKVSAVYKVHYARLTRGIA